MASKPIQSVEERFLAKVDKSGDCWIWLAGKNKRGYGAFDIDGRKLRAHRVSYELYVGKIPEAYFVCHTCDTPSCVNPGHLFIGTPKDNTQDMVSKGRHPNTGNYVTHCVHGHAYTEENTIPAIMRGCHTKKCRICTRLGSEKQKLRRLEKSKQ